MNRDVEILRYRSRDIFIEIVVEILSLWYFRY